jgi:hypothetical protein
MLRLDPEPDMKNRPNIEILTVPKLSRRRNERTGIVTHEFRENFVDLFPSAHLAVDELPLSAGRFVNLGDSGNLDSVEISLDVRAGNAYPLACLMPGSNGNGMRPH